MNPFAWIAVNVALKYAKIKKHMRFPHTERNRKMFSRQKIGTMIRHKNPMSRYSNEPLEYVSGYVHYDGQDVLITIPAHQFKHAVSRGRDPFIMPKPRLRWSRIRQLLHKIGIAY